MKRNVKILKLAFRRAWVYKGVSVVYLSLALLNYVLGLAIWNIAYKSPLQMPSAPYASFIRYYTVLLIVNQLVTSFTAGVIAEEHIKKGELSIFLTKPFPYFRLMFFLEVPWRVIAFIFSLPLITIILIAFAKFIYFDPYALLLAGGLIVLAYVLSFLIQSVFALLTFWTEDTHGLLSLVEILTILFTGVGIPIFFFPPLLRLISTFLPFQYTMYFPIMYITGQLTSTQTVKYFVALLIWIGFFLVLLKFLWRNGLKKFTGEGI